MEHISVVHGLETLGCFKESVPAEVFRIRAAIRLGGVETHLSNQCTLLHILHHNIDVTIPIKEIDAFCDLITAEICHQSGFKDQQGD